MEYLPQEQGVRILRGPAWSCRTSIGHMLRLCYKFFDMATILQNQQNKKRVGPTLFHISSVFFICDSLRQCEFERLPRA